MGLERLVDGVWLPAWSAAMNECLSEPLVIPAGGSFSDTLHVVLHPQDSTLHPLLHPGSEVAGTYRLIWYGLLADYDGSRYPFGRDIQAWERMSGTFELHR